jgi:hypothetical protein
MFPLEDKTFPANAAALRDALEKSLRRVVHPSGQMVTVEEKQYPELAAIRVSLDGANAIEGPPPRPEALVGAVEPGLQVAHFEISGRSILIRRAKVDLSCTARDVRLGQGRDKKGNVVLLLQDAAEGKLEVSVASADLEALLLAGAKAEAAKQGVTVERARIELRSRSARALDAVVHLQAKKLFLSASLRISGSVEVDQQLNARLTDLECSGNGTLGTLACGFIAPHLARFNGREFSLMALPLGDVKLRELRIEAGRELRLTARFGHAV